MIPSSINLCLPTKLSLIFRSSIDFGKAEDWSRRLSKVLFPMLVARHRKSLTLLERHVFPCSEPVS